MSVLRVIVATCLMAATLPARSVPFLQNAVNHDSAVIQDFSKRVADYVNFRRRVEAGLPSPKSGSAADVKGHQKDLSQKIRAKRTQTSQGNIFTPEVSQLFRKLIARTFQSGQGGNIRASLRHAEPVQGLSLHVNEAYPQELALQSTPPTLLSDLPKLPQDVEYRIAGRELILLDTAANLIVDLLSEALPAPSSQR